MKYLYILILIFLFSAFSQEAKSQTDFAFLDDQVNVDTLLQKATKLSEQENYTQSVSILKKLLKHPLVKNDNNLLGSIYNQMAII